MKTLKLIAVVAMLFTLGFSSGIIGARFIKHKEMADLAMGPPRPRTDIMLHRLDKRVGLSAQQKTQIRTILHETFLEIEELTKGTRPKMHLMFAKQTDRIRAVLTQEQLKVFNQFMQKRFSEHNPSPPPPIKGGKSAPPFNSEQFYQKLDAALHFSSNQKEEIVRLVEKLENQQQQIFKDSFIKRKALERELKVELKELYKELEKNIKHTLSPEQRENFYKQGLEKTITPRLPPRPDNVQKR